GGRTRRGGGQETSDQAQQPDYSSPSSLHRLLLPAARAVTLGSQDFCWLTPNRLAGSLAPNDRRARYFPFGSPTGYPRLAAFPRHRGGPGAEKRGDAGIPERCIQAARARYRRITDQLG